MYRPERELFSDGMRAGELLDARHTWSATSQRALPPSMTPRLTTARGSASLTCALVAGVARAVCFLLRRRTAFVTIVRRRASTGAGRRIDGLFRYASHPLPTATSSCRPHQLTSRSALTGVSTVDRDECSAADISSARPQPASRCRASVAQPLCPAPCVTHPSCSGGSPESRSIPSVMASRLKSRQGSLI